MVKMAAGAVTFCGALLLVLPSVSAIQRLHTISDLKKMGFGESVTKQALVLLHWFANIVGTNNDLILLTFNPDSDFGSHHYGNYDGILNILPNNRYRYYTVGNIHKDTELQLPSHILNLWTSDLLGNRARIVFRVHEQNVGWQGNRQVIDKVYITQHHGQGTEYDPQHTYRITTNLLRQIRHFPMRGDYNSLGNLRNLYGPNVDDNQLQNIRRQWNDLACLGLLLFIVLPRIIHLNNQSLTVEDKTGYSSPQSDRSRPQTDTSDFCDCIKTCLGLVLFILVVLIIFGASVMKNMKKY